MEFPRSKVLGFVACLCEFRFARYVEFANCFRVRTDRKATGMSTKKHASIGKRRILFIAAESLCERKNGSFALDSFQLLLSILELGLPVDSIFNPINQIYNRG